MSYIVAGFYTPDYAELAANLTANLDQFSIPHHFYAVSKIGETWMAQTLRKPEIALRAMDDHPGKSIILMDVDCTVRGPLDPLPTESDVTAYIFTVRSKRRIKSCTSSRVIVLRPTERTRQMLRLWHDKCTALNSKIAQMRIGKSQIASNAITQDDDETLLIRAIAETPGLTISMLPLAYSGSAPADDETALVTHDSARRKADRTRHGPSLIKRIRRKIIEGIIGKPYTEWRYGQRPSV